MGGGKGKTIWVIIITRYIQEIVRENFHSSLDYHGILFCEVSAGDQKMMIIKEAIIVKKIGNLKYIEIGVSIFFCLGKSSWLEKCVTGRNKKILKI